MLKLVQGLKTDIVATDLNNDGKIDLLDALWYLAESSAKVGITLQEKIQMISIV